MSHTDDTNPSTGFKSVGSSRFQFLRPHAKGGMGIVSIYLDSELNREVAFKEIQPQNADVESSRNEFVLEAEVTGQLEHPGIVPVYSLGKDATGRPYYAMRFVRGTNLAEDVARFHAQESSERTPAERSLQQRELLGRFLDACDAIDYAHSRGVLHRDLKPANIMLGRHGETLVVDWGVAKLTGKVSEGAEQEPVRPAASNPDTINTMVGSLKGTASYMSPEQAEGRIDRIGAATDIYGLGATLYQLLTGHPPVEGEDTGEVIRKVARGELTPPRARSEYNGEHASHLPEGDGAQTGESLPIGQGTQRRPEEMARRRGCVLLQGPTAEASGARCSPSSEKVHRHCCHTGGCGGSGASLVLV